MNPFVIVGMPRTGSTLLATGLDQHPHATCFGELFHPNEYQRSHVHALLVGDERTYFDPEKEDAIEFLQNNVFCERNAGSTAVGFKLLGEYVSGLGSQRLFLRLKQELRDLRIIHIARKNYLDVLISWEVARITKQWVILAGTCEERRTAEPILINEAMAARFFDHLHQMDRFHERFFVDCPYHRVPYEELECDYQETMNSAFRFLGLEKHPATPRTVQQRVRPTRETILNYDRLASAFAGTPYAAFFRSDG